jgi:hypothetical protein
VGRREGGRGRGRRESEREYVCGLCVNIIKKNIKHLSG